MRVDNEARSAGFDCVLAGLLVSLVCGRAGRRSGQTWFISYAEFADYVRSPRPVGADRMMPAMAKQDD